MNQTIYFRKENWEFFKDEPKKSDLLNRLLEKHYADRPVQNDIIKTPEDAKKLLEVMRLIGSAGNCKIHGTPLDWRDRCTQVGCRYA